MDNITHALSGLLLGDALLVASQWRKKTYSTGQRRRILAISAIAANVPDLDLLYTGITSGKLGYLLHHRGHTHTVVAALLLGAFTTAVVLGLSRLFSRQTSSPPNPTARFDWLPWIAGICATLLHLLFDFGNNYGIHPGWPWDNRWMYGDTFFIIEPWWLVILVGVTRAQFEGNLARRVLLAIALLVSGLCWFVDPLVPTTVAFLVTVLGAGWIYILRHASAKARLSAAGLAMAALLLSFSLGKWAAIQRWNSIANSEAADPMARTATVYLDVVATPSPGNPLCWSLLSVERTESNYRLRMVRVSALPWLQDVEACPNFSSEQTAHIELAPSAPYPSHSGVSFHGQFQAPLAPLHEVLGHDCQARAFLRFARAPFWLTHAPSGEIELLGDLRYDRTPGPDFAELSLSPSDHCPRWEPPWVPPRLDLLGGS